MNVAGKYTSTSCGGVRAPHTLDFVPEVQILNARCMDEEWWPGIAKGYVLFRAPELVRSQLMRIFIRLTYRLCSMKGKGGGGGYINVHLFGIG